ncbi:DNA translocase FtsK [candidate division WOR-3 bacterium]|uniref:DNA translocase FtsK n=1 Tax=candidate division WOR-3 bacterium TaxID=2052148 RepID=A0A660SG98_UNCW3|nr:MAG: DNA translocase FtsK [candidate division WOR-3 bacterium]
MSLGDIIPIIGFGVGITVIIYFSKKLSEEQKLRISGIFLIILSLLLLLSLISYRPKSPADNLVGAIGHIEAKGFLSLFGFYAYLFVFLIGYTGYRFLFRSDSNLKLVYFLLSITLPLLGILGLFLPTPLSGHLASLLGSVFSGYLGRIGSTILLSGLILILFLFFFEFRIPQKEIVTAPTKKKPRLRKEKPKPPAKTPPPKRELKGDFKENFLSILADPPEDEEVEIDESAAQTIIDRLKEFDVTGRITGVVSGPVITRYEFEPDPGIKLSRITSLAGDLALALKAVRIRIVAPIPGKSAVGIEVPNRNRRTVYLKKALQDEEALKRGILNVPLGEDITGKPVFFDITEMPHVLIAGTTGSGKSVCINNIIAGILYTHSHREVRFLMIDPKRLELPVYNPIPHLLRKVVVDPKDAVDELSRIVDLMDVRYRAFARIGVRDIEDYNRMAKKSGSQPKPYILIIVDELADLMMTAPSEIEERITRLAQMSRAVGIHLLLATQRPSVDVITGIIKANFPCRIAFQVASKTDSRTILDMNGAETLLGKGDMLFLPPGTGLPIRLHGGYISSQEIRGIRDLVAYHYLKNLFPVKEIDRYFHQISDEGLWDPLFDPSGVGADEKRKALANLLSEDDINEIINQGYYPLLEEYEEIEELSEEEGEIGEVDPLFFEAARLVFRHKLASVSLLQRRLNVGYARAGRIIDQLEKAGIVGPFVGSKSRDVLIEDDTRLEEVLDRFRKR